MAGALPLHPIIGYCKTRRAGTSARGCALLIRSARAPFQLPRAFFAFALARNPARFARLTRALLQLFFGSRSAEIMHPRLVLAFVRNFYPGAGSIRANARTKCANASLFPASFVACWRNPRLFHCAGFVNMVRGLQLTIDYAPFLCTTSIVQF